jgi:hypothetical protein
LRLILAGLSFFVLLWSHEGEGTIVSLAVLGMIGYWVVHRRNVEEGQPEVVEIDSATLEPSPAGGALGRMD